MRADAPTFMPYVGEVQRTVGYEGPFFKGRNHFFKGLRDLFQGFIFDVNDGERFAGPG